MNNIGLIERGKEIFPDKPKVTLKTTGRIGKTLLADLKEHGRLAGTFPYDYRNGWYIGEHGEKQVYEAIINNTRAIAIVNNWKHQSRHLGSSSATHINVYKHQEVGVTIRWKNGKGGEAVAFVSISPGGDVWAGRVDRVNQAWNINLFWSEEGIHVNIYLCTSFNEDGTANNDESGQVPDEDIMLTV